MVLAAEHLQKRYGQILALTDASARVHRGEILGLVGENGAGKSTFVRLVAGIEQPDNGTISTSFDRSRGGSCAVVPQYPRMAPTIPLLHNLIVGSEPRISRLPLLRSVVDLRRAANQLDAIARRFDIELDLTKRAGSLNGTELRLAALLAALAHNPDMLILDEPTVGLAVTDQSRVLNTVRTVRDEGMAVLYISHDLGEVSRNADRVTVLIQGRTVETFDPAPDAQTLASLLFDHRREGSDTATSVMTERSLLFTDGSADGSAGDAAPDTGHGAIAFEEVSLYDRHSGRSLGPLSFSVMPGGITAITGVRESGLDLLEQYLSCEGELSSGAIRVGGHRIAAELSPGTLRTQGIAFVPSDRFERAAALEGSVEENATVTGRSRIHPRGIRVPEEERRLTKRLLDRFDIRTHRHMPLGSLSGGTIQKLILARELETDPTICIISEPTAGLDLQSQQILLESLREIAAAGAGVIILSSSIDAVTSLAHQVVVLHDGVVQGVYAAHESEKIARAFAGLDSPTTVSGEVSS